MAVLTRSFPTCPFQTSALRSPRIYPPAIAPRPYNPGHQLASPPIFPYSGITTIPRPHRVDTFFIHFFSKRARRFSSGPRTRTGPLVLSISSCLGVSSRLQRSVVLRSRRGYCLKPSPNGFGMTFVETNPADDKMVHYRAPVDGVRRNLDLLKKRAFRVLLAGTACGCLGNT